MPKSTDSLLNAENSFTSTSVNSDVGSWLAVERINETDDAKNYIDGDVIAIDSERTTVCGGKRLIAAIGVEDVIIVDTDDVLLVCSKNNTQDVKKVIAQLKEQGRTDLV